MIHAIASRILVATAVLASIPAYAQPTPAQQSAIRDACRSDYMANCSGVPAGGQGALSCLQQNAAKVSPACQQALRAASGGAPAAAAAPTAVAAPAPVSAMPSTGPASWPHVVSGANGTATIYQPQVISWPERRTLNTRIAIGVTPTGAKQPAYGVIEVSFASQVDLAGRSVTLTDARLASAKFPSLDAAQAARLDDAIRNALASLGVKRVPLATILLSLDKQERPPEVALDNTPPRIFVSPRPASLVVFDGDPVLAPIAGTTLSFAVNTNWDVFQDSSTKLWYMLNNGGWLQAPDFRGPWLPAGNLPTGFAALPNDRNFADVKQQIPGRALTAANAPTVFLSTTPAAIIVTTGPPQYVAIAGTSLSYVANTDAALFRDASGRFYYLVSGRWFAAPGMDGPWTFATASLPPDFKRIPADGPRGFVLVSVPGTPQAEEALIEAQIPQQATLDRAGAKLDVVYAGTPQFKEIPGTPLQYAVNTSFNVIQTSEGFYSCYQGAWWDPLESTCRHASLSIL